MPKDPPDMVCDFCHNVLPPGEVGPWLAMINVAPVNRYGWILESDTCYYVCPACLDDPEKTKLLIAFMRRNPHTKDKTDGQR